MTLPPCIRKSLAGLVLLYATSTHAQVADPIAQSPLNYRHYLSHVVKQHPSVQAALNQIESARQDLAGAKWQFGPTPSIGSEKNNRPANSLTDSRTNFARLQQPLWTGGRLTAQLDRAQAQETIVLIHLPNRARFHAQM